MQAFTLLYRGLSFRNLGLALLGRILPSHSHTRILTDFLDTPFRFIISCMAKKRKSTAATTAAAEETQVEGSDASPASTSKQAFEAGQAKDAEVESIDWDATDTVKVNRHSLNELRMAAGKSIEGSV